MNNLVTSIQATELSLNPSKDLPRRLRLTLTTQFMAAIATPKYHHMGCAFANPEDSYIDVRNSFLCVGSAIYRITESEMRQIRVTFPQLRVRES